MNKKIIIAILIVAALVAGAAYLRGLFDEKATVVIDERNDAIYAALAAAGIENALVDVTDARTIVDYEVPGGMNKEVALFYVLGAAARYAAAESTITATLFENESASEEATVSARDARAFLNREINLQEFREKIVRAAPFSFRNGKHWIGFVRRASFLILPANASVIDLELESSDIKAGPLIECTKKLRALEAQCNDPDPSRNAACLNEAKRAFLACILPPGNKWQRALPGLDHETKDDIYDDFMELVEASSGLRNAFAAVPIVKLGEAAVVVVPGPGVGGGIWAKIWGAVVSFFGGKATNTVTTPSDAEEEKKETDVSVFTPATSLQFIVDTSEATRSSIEGHPHATYMRQYRPDRHSDTAGLYFALTTAIEPKVYVKMAATDGPSRDVLAMGFQLASSFAQYRTRSYEAWSQPATGELPGVGLDAGQGPAIVEPSSPTITPTPTTTPTPKPTPTPATTTPPTKPTPACTWTCGSWGACSSSGTQTRACVSSPSPCAGINPNSTSQICKPSCNIPAFQACANTFSLQGCINACPYVSATCPPGTPPDTDCKETDKACSDACWNKADAHLDGCLTSNNCTKEEVVAGGGGAQR